MMFFMTHGICWHSLGRTAAVAVATDHILAVCLLPLFWADGWFLRSWPCRRKLDTEDGGRFHIVNIRELELADRPVRLLIALALVALYFGAVIAWFVKVHHSRVCVVVHADAPLCHGSWGECG